MGQHSKRAAEADERGGGRGRVRHEGPGKRWVDVNETKQPLGKGMKGMDERLRVAIRIGDRGDHGQGSRGRSRIGRKKREMVRGNVMVQRRKVERQHA